MSNNISPNKKEKKQATISPTIGVMHEIEGKEYLLRINLMTLCTKSLAVDEKLMAKRYAPGK